MKGTQQSNIGGIVRWRYFSSYPISWCNGTIFNIRTIAKHTV